MFASSAFDEHVTVDDDDVIAVVVLAVGGSRF